MTQLSSARGEEVSQKVQAFGKDETGATAIGHGLVAALVLVATIVALLGIGQLF